MIRRAPVPDGVAAAAVAAGVVLSRLPWLRTDLYGLDSDAARIAAAGMLWAETGAYVPSRLPGYPIPELAAAGAWLLDLGPLGLSAASAVLSGLAATALFLLLRALTLDVGRAALAAVAALFVPACFAASVQAMDHVWALAPALGALAAAARGRPVLGGALLGLAVGARLPIAVYALPAVLLLPERSARTIGLAALTAITVAAAAYAVPFVYFGVGLFSFDGGAVALRHVVQRATLGVWGPLGLVALCVGAIGLLVERRSPVEMRGVGALGIGAAVAALPFLRLPLESSYLIPTVPLVVGALALLLGRRSFAGTVGLLLLSPFALDLESADALPPDVHVLAEGPGRVRLLAEGPQLVEAARARHRVAEIDTVLAAADRAEPGVGLSVGVRLPDALMAGLRRPEGPPDRWLLFDAYPPRAYPTRTADEIATLRLGLPAPVRIVPLFRPEAPAAPDTIP